MDTACFGSPDCVCSVAGSFDVGERYHGVAGEKHHGVAGARHDVAEARRGVAEARRGVAAGWHERNAKNPRNTVLFCNQRDENGGSVPEGQTVPQGRLPRALDTILNRAYALCTL